MSAETSKFSIFIAETAADHQGCIDVLERVRREELNRVAGNSVLDSGAFGGEEIDYKLVACHDSESDSIVGCLRLTQASEVAKIPNGRKEYELHIFPDWLLSRLVIATRVAVIPEFRSSPAAFMLLSSAFKINLEQGGLGMLGTCEPSIYPLYMKLGMRPIGPMHNSRKSGYRLPLLAYLDIAYLKEIRSPGYRIFAEENDEPYRKVKDWYNDFRANGFDESKTGIRFYSPKDEDMELYGKLIEGISPRGIRRLLRNALHIHCAKGDVIIPDQDGGKFMGLVYKGSLEIKKDDRHLATLTRGQLFGELAVIRGDYRTALVTSGSDDTELLLLDKKALNLPSVEDELIIWKNLSKILAERLLAMNR